MIPTFLDVQCAVSALWKNGTAKITPNHGKSLAAEVKCRIGMQATFSLMK